MTELRTLDDPERPVAKPPGAMESPVEWISVAGFKSVRSVQKLQIRKINVVIGANGSGKSNLLDVFSFLGATQTGRLGEHVVRAGGADRVLHFGAGTTDEVIIDVSFANDSTRYRTALTSNDFDQLVPRHEIDNVAVKTVGSRIQNRLDRWRLYHFQDTGPRSPFKRTCALHDNRFLQADGSNLAALLYLLRERHEESYDLIRRTVRLAAPFFDDFVLRPITVAEDMIRLEWRQAGSDSYHDASSLSDGTLRFMAIATLLLQPAQLLPSVILMDEPELGLHPYAVTLFCSLVRSVSVKAQVIIATQSPLVLDHFEAGDVLVAERRDGATTFTRLNPTSLEAWLHDYSLGQLWEKNTLGGRPRADT